MAIFFLTLLPAAKVLALQSRPPQEPTEASLPQTVAAQGGLLAQETPPVALDFDQASSEFLQRSDALRGSAAGTAAAEAQATSLRSLAMPAVSLDMEAMRYQKTIDVSVTKLKGDISAGASSLIDGLAGQFPDVPTSVLDQIGGAAQQQVSQLLAATPNRLKVTGQQNVFQPMVSVLQPIYSGGAIRAAQQGAAAAARLAAARGDSTREIQRLDLVRAYFGQDLARRALAVAQQTLDGYDSHLSDAHKLEAQGVINHARTLEVTVARDAAFRQVLRSHNDYDTASQVLAVMLHRQTPIEAATPLFVNVAGPGTLDSFIQSSMSDQPQIREADAGVDVAEQGVLLARSQFLPTVFAFGSYNLNRDHAVPITPDWIIGIGLHYSLTSSIDRGAAMHAARARQSQAESLRDQARSDLRTAVIRAYEQLDTARLQYLSLSSSMDAARENLRVHELGFREGETSAAELIEARNVLCSAQLQRAAAAYEYDLSLASLLLSVGHGDHFEDYLHRADRESLR